MPLLCTINATLQLHKTNQGASPSHHPLLLLAAPQATPTLHRHLYTGHIMACHWFVYYILSMPGHAHSIRSCFLMFFESFSRDRETLSYKTFNKSQESSIIKKPCYKIAQYKFGAKTPRELRDPVRSVQAFGLGKTCHDIPSCNSTRSSFAPNLRHSVDEDSLEPSKFKLTNAEGI